MKLCSRHLSRAAGVALAVIFISFFPERDISAERRGSLYPPEKGLVAAVYDGDTIGVRFDSRYKKVRLIGVDCPEIEDSREEVRFLALMAKRFCFYFLYNREVKLTYDRELEDKYGRLLAYVWTERTGLFNQFLIHEGYAAVFRGFPFREDYRRKFSKAERTARLLRQGLWQEEPYPVISAVKAENHLGRLVTVRFRCKEVRLEKRFVYLVSSPGEFSAVLERRGLSSFPQVNSWKGKVLLVTGFLEDFKGKPQVMVFLPRQVKVEGKVG